MNLKTMIRAKIVEGRVVPERPIHAVDNQAAVVFLIDTSHPTFNIRNGRESRGRRIRHLTSFRGHSVE